MTTSRKPDDGAGTRSGTGAGEGQRSEGLLPAGKDDDGRFDVAEEVNLDQQSDATRRVGQTPKGIASDALAESLKPDADKK